MRSIRRSHVVTVSLILGMLVVPGLARAAGPDERAVITALSEQLDARATDLELLSIDPFELQLTGVTLHRFKALDLSTGQVHAGAIDMSGNVIDLDAARRLERTTYTKRYGKLTPELFQQLESMADEKMLTVGIWLQTADFTPVDLREIRPLSQDQGTENVEEFSAANQLRLERHAAAAQAPLVAALADLGRQPRYVSTIAPLVFVELRKSEILELAERADIDRIYPPYAYSDLMDVAKVTQKADWVDNLFGYEGAGINVAILEDSRIEFGNPYLNAGTTRVPGDANVDQHATATAGMVASQHGTYQGISQGAALFSANATDYSDTNLSSAMDWAAGAGLGVEIINNSWGGNATTTTLNVHDRHLDWIVRNSGKTVIAAAGNEAGSCNSQTGRITSPARAFNVISVGNYDDNDTITWDDDVMDSCSSFVDPSSTNGDREKPELSASGSFITSTTDSSPWVNGVGSGTSYAAPMVAGAAALLMERNGNLEYRPQAVKAILMAAAGHNIEGATRLSEYDGVGGMDIRAAFSLVDQAWWGWQPVTISDLPWTTGAWLYEGQVVRGVIAWTSNPAGDYSTDPLDADFDMVVTAPSGSTVASSSSWDNNYEIVEFVPTVTGWYEFAFSAPRFDGTTEYIGYTFWFPHFSLDPNSTQSRGTPPVSNHSYQLEAGTFWNAVGVRPPSGADYDIDLFPASPFEDPTDYTRLARSGIAGSFVDFVVIDNNHAPVTDYFPMVEEYTGGGGIYHVEHATTLGDDGSIGGSYGPNTMASSDLLMVWNSYLATGMTKYFAVKPSSGDADLGLALFVSDGATSSTWYQGRADAAAFGDSGGAGSAEYISYLPTVNDWAGLVVFSSSATTSTEVMVYADTTAPTGSIMINGNAATTSSLGVSLTLSADDAQSGIGEVRLSNDGATWTGWTPFAENHAWILEAGGPGPRTVHAQYRNNAGMVSTTSTDSIELMDGGFGPPPGGWLYAYEANPGEDVAGSAGFDALDGTFSHDNGSDSWDGTGPGVGRPGGAMVLGTTESYLRVQDTGDPKDYGMADPGSNSKLYFGHDLTADGAPATLLDGVTLHFRARVSTGSPLDDLHPDGGGGVIPYPTGGDGYPIVNGGSGNIGIGHLAGGLISFSLETGGGPEGLHMNSLDGQVVSANVDTGEGWPNVLAIPVTGWHDYWVAIEHSPAGPGTHRVFVFLDGSHVPAGEFDVTAGNGWPFSGISFLGLGAGSTSESGAVDIDFVRIAQGAFGPSSLIFSDGFESGNTSAWSVTVQ